MVYFRNLDKWVGFRILNLDLDKLKNIYRIKINKYINE